MYFPRAWTLQALGRLVEQRLMIEMAAHNHKADITLLPNIDGPAVSPADFSRTPELINRAYRASRRDLSRARVVEHAPVAVNKKLAQLALLPERVA